jgi:hypothetical protein
MKTGDPIVFVVDDDPSMREVKQEPARSSSLEPFTGAAGGETNPWSGLIAPQFRRNCLKASSSATRGTLSPDPSRQVAKYPSSAVQLDCWSAK